MEASASEKSPWRSPIFVVAVGWTMMILAACWIPARGLPVTESQGSRFHIPHLDKLVHFTLFAGFGLLWTHVSWGQNGSRFHIPYLDKLIRFTLFAGFGLLWTRVSWCRNRWFSVILAGLALAVISELGQGLEIVGRDPNLLDTLADFAGVCASVALVMLRRRG